MTHSSEKLKMNRSHFTFRLFLHYNVVFAPECNANTGFFLIALFITRSRKTGCIFIKEVGPQFLSKAIVVSNQAKDQMLVASTDRTRPKPFLNTIRMELMATAQGLKILQFI